MEPGTPGVDNVLTIRDLKTFFFLDEGTVEAVNGVNLAIPRGKTIGVVGESGCGKSVTAFSILQLIGQPGIIVEGDIRLHLNGSDLVLTELNEDEIRPIRG